MLQNKIKHACTILFTIIFLLIPLIVNAEMPISIDGYFDDWTDKPHTAFYYGTYDKDDYEKISLFSDNTTLYGHIKMSDFDGRYDSFVMYFKINNSYNMELIIMPVDGNNQLDWTSTIKDFPAGTHSSLALFDNKTYTKMGNAVLVIHNKSYNPGDDVEFSISYDNISRFCNNISTSEIKTITMTCPSIGLQEVTLAGTSTEPLIGIIVTILLMVLILLYRNYRHSGKSL